MGKARCSTTLTYIKTTPLYKATVDTAKALGISADNYAKVLQDCSIQTSMFFDVQNMWESCSFTLTDNPVLLYAIAKTLDTEYHRNIYEKPVEYKIAGVQYPVSQHLIKSMEKRNAKLKQHE